MFDGHSLRTRWSTKLRIVPRIAAGDNELREALSPAAALEELAEFLRDPISRPRLCDIYAECGDLRSDFNQISTDQLVDAIRRNIVSGRMLVLSGREMPHSSILAETLIDTPVKCPVVNAPKTPSIFNLKWKEDKLETKKALVGAQVNMTADVRDIDDGATVKVKLFERNHEGNDDFIRMYTTQVDQHAIKLPWPVQYVRGNQPENHDKNQQGQDYALPTYTFTAETADGKTTSQESPALEVRGWIKCWLLDSKENRFLAKTGYTIYLTDGNTLDGTTDEKGILHHDQLKFGRYILLSTATHLVSVDPPLGSPTATIQHKEQSVKAKSYLHEAVADLLKQHNLASAERYNYQLRKWIIANSPTLKAYHDNKEHFGLADDPRFGVAAKIHIPRTKTDVLLVIADCVIDVDRMDIDMHVRLKPIEQRQEARCFNFAQGGTRHRYQIAEVDGRATVVCEGSKSAYAQGRFTAFERKKDTTTETSGTFAEEGIQIIRVAASNNRLFCYGKDRSGKHRFFWSQPEDSFPEEPRGESLPGVYVINSPDANFRKTQYAKVDEKYHSDFNRHPAWILQILGGKVDGLMSAINANLGIREISMSLVDTALETASQWRVPLLSSFAEKQLSWLKEGRSQGAPAPIIVTKGHWYEIGLVASNISDVLDIGVSDIERYETYKTEHGGEIQSWIYDKDIKDFSFGFAPRMSLFKLIGGGFLPIKLALDWAQSWIETAKLNDALMDFGRYVMPSMLTHDGMGFNDGTCNFFVLAKTKGKLTVLWSDEQEAFSEKWRILDSEDRKFHTPIGMLSVFSAIDWYYAKVRNILGLVGILGGHVIDGLEQLNIRVLGFFDAFVASLPYDDLDDYSRMAVSRNPILLTAKDKIYSLSYMWGVTDFKWNSREYPPDAIVFPQSIEIRDDTTICLWGLKQDNRGNWVSGSFYQKYLPQRILRNNFAKKNYSNKQFNHEWRFVSDDVFVKMDRYHNFGVYDAYYENTRRVDAFFPLRQQPRSHYAFKGLDDRCQYYEVKLRKGDLKSVKSVIARGPVEWVPCGRLLEPLNPIFSLYDGKVVLNIALRWDEVKHRLIAMYAHPRDDEVSLDYGSWHNRNSCEITQYLPEKVRADMDQVVKEAAGKLVGGNLQGGVVMYELSGPWHAKVAGKTYECDLEFVHMSRRFNPPAVKSATLGLKSSSELVVEFEAFDNRDDGVRFVTVGAVINGFAQPISCRHALTADQYDKKAPLVVTLFDMKQDMKRFFKKSGPQEFGTSVWFEDLVGHKTVPEQLVIRE